jgi:hypothetical protein
VIQATRPFRVGAEAGSDYFTSHTHYQSLARRIVAALRSGGRFVLVTGDPPSNSQALSQALTNVVGSRFVVIGIPCGAELRREDLKRAVHTPARPRTADGAKNSPLALPLFVFDEFDRLSDRQIEDAYEDTLHDDQMGAAGVLLARPDFLSRLEEPTLHFLRGRLAAQLRVQEVGDSEEVAFLHNQLLAQRDRRTKARGFWHGILVGLVACGVMLGTTIAAFFLLHSAAEQARESPASAGKDGSSSKGVSVLRPAETGASVVPAQTWPKTEPAAILPTAPPPLSVPSSPRADAQGLLPDPPPALAQHPASPGLSATAIATLLRRGEAFLSTGDITSARLFYERAADAGEGLAALQLGATFDPLFLGRAGIRGVTADQGQALYWYRRASALGNSEAERRLEILQMRPLAEPDIPSR